ncbi:ras-related protein Rab-12 [Panthera pardus]|uniref:small monomeric GTPase n=3 Tax=Felidae TaxID=9681 RepID=A0ABI7WED7_FELCA|nr:ras-related protein Rab-12 [Felis catus]XP_019273992.1 ras-related protein Rab-12 [Panthera pardus]XP_042766106.1 ras-related protein Rab-12 [Panthera leo]XP_043414248.1 ras-related protein Rab-12 [Prionailurus bengalensis]XP_045312872.1 ras-related protein Rab-12 [Leopardus geoffroyi]XP_047683533.1 ras-related protein Rab-12 [Prionailurus viverrinus]XP_058548666.1 ras-related protein Rab-12 [Neofelis nebulosa]XP_060469257.1 ras-related protein Rab-12 [Panthera onca]
MLLPLLRSSCFPSSSPGGGSGGGSGGGLDAGAGDRPEAQLQRGIRGLPGPLERADVEPGADPRRAAEAEGAPGPGARGPGAGGGGRRAEREPYACMDPAAALQRRAGGGGGLGAGSPALSGGQARRRKQPPRPADFKLQVIIIGSRGVGKTSLMERFTDDTFCEACKSTVGVDFKIKTVELRGKKIRLQIWDTAGQERFNSITSAYYRSAKGIILVYDITKKETFDDLPKWMKMIDKYASEDAELLLVGNKLDCETDREITRQQGEKFAQQITGMRFCEASAKDNFNVDEIFLKLVDDILKKMPLDILRNELSNSILSLQPEPEIPPELPPPRPHVRCC